MNETQVDAATPKLESRTSPNLMDVPLELIHDKAGTESRQLKQRIVKEYAELWREAGANSIFPPIELYQEPGENRYYLADGFHRVAAARLADRKVILAKIRPGTRTDALLASLGANHTHGQRRSLADKRYAVDKALCQFSDRSDRVIAGICNVCHTFVGKRRASLRKASTGHVASSVSSGRQKRRGRDGKVRRLPQISEQEKIDETRREESTHSSNTQRTAPEPASQAIDPDYPHYPVQSSIFGLLVSALQLSRQNEVVPGAALRQRELEAAVQVYYETCEATKHLKSAPLPVARQGI